MVGAIKRRPGQLQDVNTEVEMNDEESELQKAIDENTKFFLLKIPNSDCLMNSLALGEIALTENSSQAFKTIFERDMEDQNMKYG